MDTTVLILKKATEGNELLMISLKVSEYCATNEGNPHCDVHVIERRHGNINTSIISHTIADGNNVLTSANYFMERFLTQTHLYSEKILTSMSNTNAKISKNNTATNKNINLNKERKEFNAAFEETDIGIEELVDNASFILTRETNTRSEHAM